MDTSNSKGATIAIRTFSKRKPLATIPPNAKENHNDHHPSKPIWKSSNLRTSGDSEIASIDADRVLNSLSIGAKEDLDFLKKNLHKPNIEIPVDWSLERQLRVGEWLQIIGFTVFWEGGYMSVSPDMRLMRMLKPAIDHLNERKKKPANREYRIPVEKGDEAQRKPAGNHSVATNNNDSAAEEEEEEEEMGDFVDLELLNGFNAIKVSTNEKAIPNNFSSIGDKRDMKYSESITVPATALAPSSSEIEDNDIEESDTFMPIPSVNPRFLNARRRRSTLAGDTEAVSRRRQTISTVATRLTFSSKIEIDSLLYVFGFLRPQELLRVMPRVCRTWRRLAKYAFNSASARVLASASLDLISSSWVAKHYIFQNMLGLCEEFPIGAFLSEGTYKQVYKVWNAPQNRFEAISVMDIGSIEKNANVAVVIQEVGVSILLSRALTDRICPNFIETYQTFQFSYNAPLDYWNAPIQHLDRKNPSATELLAHKNSSKTRFDQKRKSKGNYQFIRMELCEGGDLESYMKKLPEKLFSTEEVRNIMFQMTFSLMVGQKHVSLRHYDVKLLNFFAKTTTTTTNLHSNRLFYYGFQNQIYAIQGNIVIKLADYGTADISTTSLGEPIHVDHFTTLENTPIEFLLHDGTPQSFMADTFCLGLAFLHLFTGNCPYEEILSEVKCPDELLEELAEIWEMPGSSNENGITPFSALKKVLACDEDNILYHTIYRYLVLFGGGGGGSSKWGPTGKVWNKIQKVLGICTTSTSKTKVNSEAWSQFSRDRRIYSLVDGTNPLIARARDRLRSTEGAWELLIALLSFDPSRRPSMDEVLTSEFFDPLVLSKAARNEYLATISNDNQPSDENSFMHYYNRR